MTEIIIVGLIFLPIIGSVIGYNIGYHDAKKIYQLAIIWWTWRIEEDTTEAATVIHLIFLFSSLIGLILIE